MDAIEQVGLKEALFVIQIVGIVISVALVVYFMTVDSVDSKTFDRVKDVLTMIIAVFATVTGFYFGSLVEESQVCLPRQRVEQMERSLEAVRQIQSLSREQAKAINYFLSLSGDENIELRIFSTTENLFFAFVGALLGVICQHWTRTRMIIAFLGAVVLFGTVFVLA